MGYVIAIGGELVKDIIFLSKEFARAQAKIASERYNTKVTIYKVKEVSSVGRRR